MAPTFPEIEIHGSPCDLGSCHGEQAREQIRGYLDYLSESLGLSRQKMRDRAVRFLPLFEQSCPQLVPEIQGLATGAGIEFADALAVQIRGELGQISEEACTTFVIGGEGTSDGNVLIGQTSDMAAELADFGYVLRVRPDDRPAALMWTFGGMLGYHGVNAHGVAHFANALGGGPAWTFALPHYPLKRLMLEQTDLRGVLELLQRIPVCSHGNYVLCDGAGNILDVELTSTGPLILEDAGRGYLAHSNHFLCAPHNCPENFKVSLPDSFPRLERIQVLIEEIYGAITVADCRRILSDHAGYPVGICRHPQTGQGYGDTILPPSGRTVAALIAEPMAGRLHVCRGNPCGGEFVTHEI